ncbi:hypothetical protein BS47DRAFT_1342553, partial [Hydnum rufescens UP504]
MFLDPKPAQVPDYLMMSNPKAVLRFVFAGVPRRFLRYMRHLRIQFDFPYQPWSKEHEMYLIAIRIVLRIVPELVDLVLLWNNVPSRVFDGVSFKLEALTCTMDMQGALDFLAQQSELRLVELLIGTPFRMLWTFHNSSFRSCWTSGSPQDKRKPTGVRPIQALAMSQCSIDDLAIATLTSFPLSILGSMKYLPYLRTLYIRVYGPEPTTTDIFQWSSWRPHLTHLPRLETIKVEIDCRYMQPKTRVRFVIPTQSCIQEWGRICPGLSAVDVGLYAGDSLLWWERKKSPWVVAERRWLVVKGFVRFPRE